MTAFGKTKTAAERALLAKLQDRARTNQSGELTAMHKISHLVDLWEKKFEERIAGGQRSPTSLDTYRRAIKNHIRPALAELRIGEATTQRIDTAITKIKERAGAPTAKTCRAILSGMMKIAVRYGAISVNPVREIEAIEAEAKNPPRTLTVDEVTLLRKSLAADDRAVQADLPDLVTFMLGTGVRIGESLAVLWSQIDLEAGTVVITDTIARVTVEGLIRKRTKPADASSTFPTGPPPCCGPATPPASASTTPSSPTSSAASATPPTPVAPSEPPFPPSAAPPAAT
ncbi:hypothetical protein EV652_12191 [Kribbella steppae]|uniref:Phage integrase central domain-containing protein n=1 Tax=Kribbella steppae TaxID=2512223 RepID=A0A4V6NMV8_9ACTN|nr:site-specific integrase [Kribbella steppae]TCO15718.1 hypothetical protein EV652_12191 [Kribbella steppae]